MVKLPLTSSLALVLRWNENAMKFGSEGFCAKRLYSRLLPCDEPVPFNIESMEDRDVKPRPKMPLAP